LAIQGRFHQANTHGAIPASGAPVCFTCPYHFDRPPAEGIGDCDRLLSLRTIPVAAVAATLECRMDIHVLRSDARQFRRLAKQTLRILVSAPDIDAIIGD